MTLIIQSIFVRAGYPVNRRNGSTVCNQCADTDEVRLKFSPVTWTQCLYRNCDSPPSKLNGFVCQSFHTVFNAAPIIKNGSFYNPGTSACVSNFKVKDCSQTPSSYNIYVCQSCYQASGAIFALNIGNFYNTSTSACVASCPKGTTADNTNTCQPIPTKPGNSISCSSIGSCYGCGATSEIQNLFTAISDLTANYVCQSCYQASGAIFALNIGNFYNPSTSACVAFCPRGITADNTNTCQPIPTKPGNSISCGSGGRCSGCDTTSEIQNLFTQISGSNCKVIDCSQTPPSYNSYVCQSCYQVPGAVAALNIGNYYDPSTSTCITSCPQGTTADNTYICQQIPTKPGSNNISCSSSGTYKDQNIYSSG
ncbi:hypothetical protein ABPG72_015954 [Tetrahymena utriculariae]